LGNIEAPFFGAPKREKREERRKRTPFFAVGLSGFTEAGRGGFAVVFFVGLALCRLF
jgi:hypothetical protein